MLKIENLRVSFETNKNTVQAVDGVCLEIDKGKIIGLVGESGCGKTVTALSILNLLASNSDVSGSICWGENNILKLSRRELRAIRGKQISMIFQNPVASLNPVFTVGSQIVDVLRLHHNMTKAEAKKEAIKLFQTVKIPEPEKRLKTYPHQFSGGMCQRIMIAMAIAAEPKLLIADEPTASLDVTIQAQIISLLKELKDTQNMSVLMISHDLGVVASLCDRIAVMYLGRIVEEGTALDIFENPRHPYTEALLKSIPKPDPKEKNSLTILKGDVPSPIDLPIGCRFASRCPYKQSRCEEKYPEFTTDDKGHKVACFLPLF